MRQFECAGEVNVGDELLVAGSKSAKASGIVLKTLYLW